MKPSKSLKLIFACLAAALSASSQTIDTLVLVKSLTFSNMSVDNLDSFFDTDYQLVAFSNTSGNNDYDTLVIYDLKNDVILQKIAGNSWNYDLHFISENRLLYLNQDDTIHSLENFSAPEEKILCTAKADEKFKDFTVSGDKNLLVVLIRIERSINMLKWFNYDRIANTLSVIDSLIIGDQDIEANMVLSDDKKYLAMNGGYEYDSVTLVNLNTKEVSVIATSPNGGTYSPVFFRQDDQLKVAVGGSYANGGIEIIDVETRSLIRSVPAFSHYVYALAVDTSQQYLACGGFDEILRIYGIDHLAFDTIISLELKTINTIQFSADNKYLLVGQGYSDAPAILEIYKMVDSSSVTSVVQHENNDFGIYPVPVHDKLIIEKTYGINHFAVYSITGELIWEGTLLNGEIDFTNLREGIYLIRFLDNEKVVSCRKIIRN
jgi:WD40 repeat protein